MDNRIPAWKKLGLTLKATKESDELLSLPTSRASFTESVDGGSSKDVGHRYDTSKRREEKRGRMEEGDNGKRVGSGTQREIKAKTVTPTAFESQNQTAKSNTKKVIFSVHSEQKDDSGVVEEDEVEDGAIKISEHKGNESEEAGNATRSLVSSGMLSGEQETKRAKGKMARQDKKEKFKRPKKSARYSDQQNKLSESNNSPILSYLSTYHQDRSAWKFHKNRETHLLKNALSLSEVPASYNEALFSYLHGLKSKSARQRSIDSAQEVIAADDRDLDQPTIADEDRIGYKNAIAKYRSTFRAGEPALYATNDLAGLSSTLRGRAEKRFRAELIAWAVQSHTDAALSTFETSSASKPALRESRQDDSVNDSMQLNQSLPNKPARRKKKRKTRTAVVEFSSSESSSDTGD
jgi:hypothetical protein